MALPITPDGYGNHNFAQIYGPSDGDAALANSVRQGMKTLLNNDNYLLLQSSQTPPFCQASLSGSNVQIIPITLMEINQSGYTANVDNTISFPSAGYYEVAAQLRILNSAASGATMIMQFQDENGNAYGPYASEDVSSADIVTMTVIHFINITNHLTQRLKVRINPSNNKSASGHLTIRKLG